MVRELGKQGVSEYLSLTSAAKQGQVNTFLERAQAVHGSRDRAIASAKHFEKILTVFAKRFGNDRQVWLYESPGRVNLMGMHIDHRGGIVNPVATQERVRAVCSRREDDQIVALSMSRNFGEASFRLSDRLPTKRLSSMGEWLNWTEGEALSTGGGKNFINYFACGPLYLACFWYPWGHRFFGAEFVLDSDLPPSAGLSSSSALVIMATDVFLRCNREERKDPSLDELLDIYGIGEWYIGTRGGKGDHGAIKLCRRGSVQPTITTPDFQAREPASFPEGYDIILYQSGDEANKSVEPFRTGFNAPIIAYHAAEMYLTDYLREHEPAALERLLAERAEMDVKHHRVYIGDVVNDGMLSEQQIYAFLRTLPRVISQDELFACFRDHPGNFHDGVQQACEPPGGYRVRDVAAYGFSECARAKQAALQLSEGHVDEFAEMMNISQIGDNVTEEQNGAHSRIKFLTDDALTTMQNERFVLRKMAGDYHVSTPNVDRLTSVCLACPDVLGARMCGAGLGGTVIVLGKEGFDEHLDPVLQRDYYQPLKRTLEKIRIIPSQGAEFY